MSTPVATSAVRLNTATVTQYLASESRRFAAGKRRAVLLRAAPVWDGPVEVQWSTGRARVAVAPSPLAVYELVLGHLTHVPGPGAGSDGSEGAEVLVVLTDREEAEVGPDLLAKVYRQRVNAVDAWDVVRESFGARGTDNRLTSENWAAEALLDATPPAGWPPVAGGPLTRRKALGELTLRRLGIGRHDPERDPGALPAAPDGDVLDVRTLLHWSLAPGGPERFLTLREAERQGIAKFLSEVEQGGPTGRALLALVAAEHGPDAVAFGLVCAALWVHADGSEDAEDYRARGRVERWLGDEPPAHAQELDVLVAAFGRSCEEFVRGLLLSGRAEFDERAGQARRMTGAVLDRAAALARQFGAERAAMLSPVLAVGLEARFTAVGLALTAGDAGGIAEAVEALTEHELAKDGDSRARIERARMAQRLAQWQAAEPAPGPATDVGTVSAGVGRHMSETGWVDLALEHIEAGGDSDPALKSAYDTLCASVSLRRRDLDKRFAQRLATWTTAGTDSGTMLTVESFLSRVVAPVVKAGERGVLLLVLDGMSAAIAAELGEQLREKWAEYDPVPPAKASDRPRRRAMAAALPTITAVSRTSLFAGRLTNGAQADEKRLFPAHRFWGGQDVAVFHKDDLRGESGGAPFGPELSEALDDTRTHVAVVLNTVDDRLGKESKLGDGAWRLDQIGALPELLQSAARYGRAVIITSDHGHVVDRYGSKVDAEGALSARHRPPGGPLAESEIALSGPRVVSPEPGGEIVALWDADSRYTARKAGYHGGASLAEFTIPVLALLPFGAEPPKGWRELGSQQPAWWALSGDGSDSIGVGAAGAGAGAGGRGVPEPTRPAQSSKVAKRRREEAERAASGEQSLFEVAEAPAPATELPASASASASGATPDRGEPASRHDALVRALLESETFDAQVQLLARKPPRARVEKAVHALLDAGGTLPVTALAQRVGLPGNRAGSGFAAVLRQLLNYDGVQVLETLPDGRTLRLHTSLLREQFAPQ